MMNEQKHQKYIIKFGPTSKSPSNILVDIRNPVPVFVKTGVKIVRVAVAPIPVKNTRFPPYLN